MIGTGIGLGLSGYRFNPGNWDPLRISDLQLWLDSSDSTTLYQSAGGSIASADGDPVGQWQDKSGNSRHATQSDGTKRPALKISVKNSRNSLLFDGVNDQLNISTLTVNPFDIFMVFNRTASNSNSNPIGSDTPNNYPLDWYSDSRMYLFDNLGNYFNSTNQSATGWFIVRSAKTSSGASLTEMFRNGSLIASSASGISGGLTLDFVGRHGASDYHKNYLSEIIIYSKKLSSSEVSSVNQYLNTKWSIY